MEIDVITDSACLCAIVATCFAAFQRVCHYTTLALFKTNQPCSVELYESLVGPSYCLTPPGLRCPLFELGPCSLPLHF